MREAWPGRNNRVRFQGGGLPRSRRLAVGSRRQLLPAARSGAGKQTRWKPIRSGQTPTWPLGDPRQRQAQHLDPGHHRRMIVGSSPAARVCGVKPGGMPRRFLDRGQQARGTGEVDLKRQSRSRRCLRLIGIALHPCHQATASAGEQIHPGIDERTAARDPQPTEARENTREEPSKIL